MSLARAANHGDHDAYSALVTHFLPKIETLRGRFPGMLHLETEDILLEVLPKTLGRLNQLSDPASLDAYLLKAAANRITDHYRQEKVRRAAEETYSILFREEVELPCCFCADEDRGRELDKAVNALPPHFKAAYILRYQENLSLREISHCLQIRPDTTEKRLRKTRKLLAKALSKKR